MVRRFGWALALLFVLLGLTRADAAPNPQNSVNPDGGMELCDDHTVPPPDGCTCGKAGCGGGSDDHGGQDPPPKPSKAPTAGLPVGCVRTSDPIFHTDFSWKAPDEPEPVWIYRVAVYRPPDVNNSTGLILDRLTYTTILSGSDLDLTQGIPFHWQVWAGNPGGYGPGLQRYFMGCAQEVLPITAPAGCIDTLRPEIDWRPVNGATGYHLLIIDTADHTRRDVQLGAHVVSYAIPSDLASGHEYAVQVSTPSGDLSPWRYFTVQCSAGAPPGTASLSWPLGGGDTHTSTTPLFVFEEAVQATEYRLKVVNGSSITAASSVIEVDQVYSSSEICGGGQCAIPSPAVLSSGVHTWQVQAANPAGTGPGSGYGHFTVGP